MRVKILNGYNKDAVFPDLIDQPKRKLVRQATSGPFRKRGPRTRISNDPDNCSLDLHSETVTESFALKVVIGYGLRELSVGRIKEVNLHDFCLAIFSNTRLAGTALICP